VFAKIESSFNCSNGMRGIYDYKSERQLRGGGEHTSGRVGIDFKVGTL
jgi:hypothetical protein